MYIIRRVLAVCLLAFFVLSLSVSAAECSDGTVLYRQRFDVLSAPGNGGIRKGTDGGDSFSLHIEKGALRIDNHSDTKSYTLFPCELPGEDHTIEFEFSFESVESTNAYAAFMLTCRGDAPDNITSVIIRANGECDGFGKLGKEISANIASGQRTFVRIPVSDGDYYEMTVLSGGVSETLSRRTVGGIPKGSIGFIVRNSDINVYDIAVVKGTNYTSKLGELSYSSSWSDSSPYKTGDAATACEDVDVYLSSPQTGDSTALILLVSALSTASALVIRKRRA